MGHFMFWYLVLGWFLAVGVVLVDAVDAGPNARSPSLGLFLMVMLTGIPVLLLHVTLAALSWYTGKASVDNREDNQ
jgi:predicted membrane channel-forming protein YqfA (hemolysin III family)